MSRVDTTWHRELESIQRPAAPHQSSAEVRETSIRTYFSDMDTPSLASLQAAATTSGVRRFRVPLRSFLPSLSKKPHAQPWGMPSTAGRSSKLGIWGAMLRVCTTGCGGELDLLVVSPALYLWSFFARVSDVGSLLAAYQPRLIYVR
jgi:hypothetical protein